MSGDNRLDDILEVIQRLHPELDISADTVTRSNSETLLEDSYKLEKQEETLEFSRDELELLVFRALSSKKPEERVVSAHYHSIHDRSDDYAGCYEVVSKTDSAVDICLSLEIAKGTPFLSIKCPSDVKRQSFADHWEGCPSEGLYNVLVHMPSGGSWCSEQANFYKRWAASRILSRKNHEPTAAVLMSWLEHPKLGIGSYTGRGEPKGKCYEFPDAEEEEVKKIAAEGLGIMRYEPARELLQSICSWDVHTFSKLARIAKRGLDHLDGVPYTKVESKEDLTLCLMADCSSCDTDFHIYNSVGFDAAVRNMSKYHARPEMIRYLQAISEVVNINVDKTPVKLYLANMVADKDIPPDKFDSICSKVNLIAVKGVGFDDSPAVVNGTIYGTVRVNSGVENEVFRYLGGLKFPAKGELY